MVVIKGAAQLGGAVGFAMQGQGADECSVVVGGPVNGGGAVHVENRDDGCGCEGVWGNERTPGRLAMGNDLEGVNCPA